MQQGRHCGEYKGGKNLRVIFAVEIAAFYDQLILWIRVNEDLISFPLIQITHERAQRDSSGVKVLARHLTNFISISTHSSLTFIRYKHGDLQFITAVTKHLKPRETFEPSACFSETLWEGGVPKSPEHHLVEFQINKNQSLMQHNCWGPIMCLYLVHSSSRFLDFQLRCKWIIALAEGGGSTYTWCPSSSHALKISSQCNTQIKWKRGWYYIKLHKRYKKYWGMER